MNKSFITSEPGRYSAILTSCFFNCPPFASRNWSEKKAFSAKVGEQILSF